jgi:hypothetical protein
MQPRQLLHQRQPDSRALVRAATGAGHAMEPFEKLRHLVRRNAGAGVAHGELDVRANGAQADLDLAFESEFERIRDEIENDLLPHLAVNKGRLRQRRTVDGEVQPGLLDCRAKHARKLGRVFRKVGRLVARLNAARLDAGEIEQRVDELQQPQAVAVDELDLPAMGRARRGFRSELALEVVERPQHQRQRRAKFVADIGEEGGFCAIDRGQHLGPLALLLVGSCAGDGDGDTARHQLVEIAIKLVEGQPRADPGYQQTSELAGLVGANWHHHGAVRLIYPRANRYIEPGTQVRHGYHRLTADRGSERPSLPGLRRRVERHQTRACP